MAPTNPLSANVAARVLTGDVRGSRRPAPWAAVDCPPDEPTAPRRPRARLLPRFREALRPRPDTGC
jgi:hypothetical protein